MGTPKIEEWSIVNRVSSPYHAPETGNACIYGVVYNDMRAADGTAISTSIIKKIDLKEMTVQTRNTLYQLGNISDDFESYMSENGYTINQYVEVLNAQ